MAFAYNTLPLERIPYSPGARFERNLPRGNILRGLKALLKGKINIVTAATGSAPDFNVWNLVDILEVRRGSQIVMRVDGQKLAAIFTFRNGIAAADNLQPTTAVAAGILFQHYLNLPFAPDDAAVPADYMMDTRAHAYTLSVTWKDAKNSGVLFGTNPGNVAVASNSDIYLDIEMERVEPVSVSNEAAEKLMTKTPFMRGLHVVSLDVLQDGKQVMDFPKDKTVRNIFLFTTEVNNNSEIGRNTVLSDAIELYTSQNVRLQTTKSELVRQDASQKLGLGNALPAGLYKLDVTAFGNITDAVRDTEVNRFRLGLDCKKLAGATKVHAVFDCVEQQ